MDIVQHVGSMFLVTVAKRSSKYKKIDTFSIIRFLSKMSLNFKIQGDSLLIAGKAFYIKEYLKSHGGTWNPLLRCWRLHSSLDTLSFRTDLVNRVKEIIRKERERSMAEAKEKQLWTMSPEGIAERKLETKNFIKNCLAKKSLGEGYHWICCEECEVIDWSRQHTKCDACAGDDIFKNNFFVRGSLYTGD